MCAKKIELDVEKTYPVHIKMNGMKTRLSGSLSFSPTHSDEELSFILELSRDHSNVDHSFDDFKVGGTTVD